LQKPVPEVVPDPPVERREALSTKVRLGILAGALALLFGVAWATGLLAHFEPEAIRAKVNAAGPWGPLVIVGLTVGSNFIHVPALPFILLSQATWGALLGSVYAWVASFAATIVVYLVVKRAGGNAAEEIQKPWIQKLLGHLQERPVLVVFLLRAVTIASPPVTYALALSGMKTRDYLIGSALGLVLPIALYALVLELFGWTPGL
jgi:uncharacterized membrane protein YdjX (TVP38/TMEM64 family)